MEKYPLYLPNGLIKNLVVPNLTNPINNNIFLTPNLQCTGNIVFGKIKINKNDGLKIYYNDILIFDEKEYLEQDNQFIKIIKETNV